MTTHTHEALRRLSTTERAALHRVAGQLDPTTTPKLVEGLVLAASRDLREIERHEADVLAALGLDLRGITPDDVKPGWTFTGTYSTEEVE